MTKLNRRKASFQVATFGPEPIVAVIILSWNGKDHTLACLECVDKLAYPGKKLQLLVVDNGSTDGSQATIRGFLRRRGKRFLDAQLHALPDNIGAPAAFNRALDLLHQRVQVVWKLDNDVTFGRDYLSRLVGGFVGNDNIGGIGGRILGTDGSEQAVGAVLRPPPRRWMSVLRYGHASELNGNPDVVLGASCLFPKTVFSLHGRFDERFFLYYDDTEYCLRLRNKGLVFTFVPDAVLFHSVSSSTGDSAATRLLYMTRNHYLLGMTYFRGLERLLFLVLQVLTIPWKMSRMWRFYPSLKIGRIIQVISRGVWLGLSNRHGRIEMSPP